MDLQKMEKRHEVQQGIPNYQAGNIYMYICTVFSDK